jgi:hypothetical protein
MAPKDRAPLVSAGLAVASLLLLLLLCATRCGKYVLHCTALTLVSHARHEPTANHKDAGIDANTILLVTIML